MKSVDAVVCVVVVALSSAGLGISYGQQRAEAKLASKCLPQATERLVSTIQTTEGVTCVFSLGHGRAKTKRAAT